MAVLSEPVMFAERIVLDDFLMEVPYSFERYGTQKYLVNEELVEDVARDYGFETDYDIEIIFDFMQLRLAEEKTQR